MAAIRRSPARTSRAERAHRVEGRYGAARRLAAGAMLLALTSMLGGCSSLGYYVQAARGQWSLMSAARPIDDWLSDPAASDELKQRLRAAREIRAFASASLALPDNRSYTRYADLKRPAAVWNVFATPELSTALKTWCYPFFGCAAYRGFFDRADADRLAARLAAQGYDTSVGAVPAYSTLGWLPDPLLNTFIGQPEPELARMIFHELAHQVVYVGDDTVFNESFATAVEREGVQRWLQAHGSEAQRAAWPLAQQRRSMFIELVTGARRELDSIYAGSAGDEDKRRSKREAFDRLRERYRRLRDGEWGGYAGYDRFFEQSLNNAHLAAIGAYFDRVPAFAALVRRCGPGLAPFFREVRRLGRLKKEERDRELDLAASGSPAYDESEGACR